jgi:hypothetical protein
MSFRPFDYLRSRLVTAEPDRLSKRHLCAANSKEATILPRSVARIRNVAPLAQTADVAPVDPVAIGVLFVIVKPVMDFIELIQQLSCLCFHLKTPQDLIAGAVGQA